MRRQASLAVVCSLLSRSGPRKFGLMSQPYGQGAGVAHPPPPPAGPPPQWYPGASGPAPAKRRAAWPWVVGAAAAIVVATATAVGVTASIVGRDSAASPPPPATAPAAVPSAAEATSILCDTLEREYPAIVAAIDDQNLYNREPWTNPDLIRTSDKLAQVSSLAAAQIEHSTSDALPASSSKAASDYVTALRAMSIAHSNRAVAKQLNGVASLYNSVVDPMLAVCGMKG